MYLTHEDLKDFFSILMPKIENELKIDKIMKKYEELVKYFIIGVITTIINYVIFAIFSSVIKIDIHISNIIAWVVSVIFAYITNKFGLMPAIVKELNKLTCRKNKIKNTRIKIITIALFLIYQFLSIYRL